MHRAVAKKKNSCTGNGPKKNSGRQKISHPPHHFSNGPSLRVVHLQHLLTDSEETEETTLSLLEMTRRESTLASLSCLRGYHSNMAPGTVKRAIRLEKLRLPGEDSFEDRYNSFYDSLYRER